MVAKQQQSTEQLTPTQTHHKTHPARPITLTTQTQVKIDAQNTTTSKSRKEAVWGASAMSDLGVPGTQQQTQR